MKYTANAHIEDGQVLCACSNCVGCDFRFFNKCVEVEINDKEEIKKRLEEEKKQLTNNIQ